jgi:ribosomal-protein-alanine N-acetyltransferase
LLITKRLKLKIAIVGEAKETSDFYIENKNHLAPWDPQTPTDFYSLKYWEKKNQISQDEFLMKSALRLNIYLLETNELIGMCHYTGIERGPFQNCHLGYKLGEKFQGHGYMHEALETSLRYIFENWNLHRVEANYIPRNKRSAKVLAELGFKEHGIAERYLHIAGSWQDHMLTSLINENWKQES